MFSHLGETCTRCVRPPLGATDKYGLWIKTENGCYNLRSSPIILLRSLRVIKLEVRMKHLFTKQCGGKPICWFVSFFFSRRRECNLEVHHIDDRGF
jgi:hypothetical protein